MSHKRIEIAAVQLQVGDRLPSGEQVLSRKPGRVLRDRISVITDKSGGREVLFKADRLLQVDREVR